MNRAGAPLTVVVPVYNEGENIRQWWSAARPYLPSGASVRIIYDFEEDDTVPVVQELAAGGAPLTVERNLGKGVRSAMITGMRTAGCGPVLVSMADLSDDLAVLPRMLDAYRAGADIVVASRFMSGGQQLGGPWLKGQLSRWGGRSLKWLAGFPSSDATNSFRLYDAELLARTPLGSGGGFELAFEITLKAWMAGARIAEVPTTWRDRVHGTSRFAFRKWLPLYASLWARALRFGLRRRLWA